MAQIDLRNALVEIIDGYTLVGAVANLAGYAAGALTIAISGMTVAIPNGSTFKIAGESGAPTHTVVSTVGGTTPTSITFTTAIASGGVANGAAITLTISTGSVSVDAIAGATTVTVTGFTTAIKNGSTFTIAGETGSPTHTVTSTVGGATPTSITFTGVIATGGITSPASITLLESSGIINQPGPVSVGNTTVTISGITVAIPNGMEFHFAGSLTTYKVISTVGGSTPTSVTFFPAFQTGDGSPVNGTAITFGPHALEIKIGEGTLTYNEKRNMEYTRNRRVIAFVRTGDDEPMDVSFNFIWEFLRSASGESITVEEAIKGMPRAIAAGWTTSGGDVCEPYTVNIRITYIPPCSDVDMEIITLREYRWEGGNHDLKNGTVDSTGKCKISQADLDRAAQAA
jgi:hypothetical protein